MYLAPLRVAANRFFEESAVSTVLQEWVGSQVILTLRAVPPIPLEGILAEGDTNFVVLDQGDEGALLVPVASILHIAERRPRQS